MKAPTSNLNPSSFHNTTIVATPQELINLADSIGSPYYSGNDGEGKTNFDFEFETDNGIYFTVYDWKEYRPLGINEEITWHIGGKTGSDTRKAVVELAKSIESVNN